MDDIYRDPDDETMKSILKQLENIGDKKEIETLIKTTFPSWLRYSTDRYSNDYPHLNKNWEIICSKTGVKKQKIVLVNHIIKDDDHLLINIFCERMTREGYVVRRDNEFIGCEKCSSAIPVEKLYNYMKNCGIVVPEKWSDTCTECL